MLVLTSKFDIYISEKKTFILNFLFFLLENQIGTLEIVR